MKTQKIKTFEDALKVVGETKEAFEQRTQFDSIDEKAFKKLKLIAKALNGKRKLNFFGKTKNWYIWWTFNVEKNVFVLLHCNYDYAYSTVGAHLSVKSEEIARYFSTQFSDVWNDLLLNKEE
jgi:hypothetical protein